MVDIQSPMFRKAIERIQEENIPDNGVTFTDEELVRANEILKEELDIFTNRVKYKADMVISTGETFVEKELAPAVLGELERRSLEAFHAGSEKNGQVRIQKRN